MPRYCAVKVCRNRRGTALKQDNDKKRVSFYPFPLHDKTRLQQWVDNIKRGEWTPSRHQYLCSEHFTDDCFDIRWGIRYLKNTAIPNISPSEENDVDKDIATIKSKPESLDQNTHSDELLDSPFGNKLLVLSKSRKETHTSDAAERHGDGTVEPPLRSHTAILCHSTCQVTDDSRTPTASPCGEPLHKEHADSAATVLRCEKLRPLSDGEADINSSVLEAALGQAISINTVVMVMDDPTGTEGSGYGNGEHVTVCEHSYSRPDTDKHQLWKKIFSLHAKILDLGRREESAVAKIHALEAEVSHLKRDSAVCKEKQKILEDIISSKMV